MLERYYILSFYSTFLIDSIIVIIHIVKHFYLVTFSIKSTSVASDIAEIMLKVT